MKSYRNIVFVGFNYEEQQKIKIIDTRKQKEEWSFLASYRKRFPYVIYLNDISESLKHQGFAIIIKYRGETSLEEFWKKHYKHLSKKYYHVIVCNNYAIDKSKFPIETIVEEKLYDDKIMLEVNSWYFAFLKSEEKKRKIEERIKTNPEKGNIALKLKDYLKDKDNITSKEVALHFNIPLRTAQRYMSYMNDIFENVKYDAKTKTWVKK